MHVDILDLIEGAKQARGLTVIISLSTPFFIVFSYLILLYLLDGTLFLVET